jgi:hypothetical protein
MKKLILFSFMAVLMTITIVKCSETNESSSSVIGITPPLFEGENFRLNVYNRITDAENPLISNPLPDIILRGDVDETFERTNEIQVTNLRVLYNTINQETQEIVRAQLNSDYAIVNYQTKDFTAWGHVVAIKDGEFRLETSKIHWDNANEVMKTEPDEPVMIYRIDGTVSVGKNLVLNKELDIEMQETLTEAPKDFDESQEFLNH